MNRTQNEQVSYLNRQLERPPHLSEAARSIFHELYAAYSSGNREILDLSVNKKSEKDEGHTRNLISVLRTWVQGKVFQLPDQIPVEFRIPSLRPYHLEETTGFSPMVLWAPHIENHEDLLIHTFEKLFFNYKTLYLRDIKVNHPGQVARIAALLRNSEMSLSPSMHYVSSGELRAAVALQDFFVDSAGKRAKLSSGTDVASSQNIILMCAPRVESALAARQGYEHYKVFQGGVRPNFFDRTEDPQQGRTVHVLMSRRGKSPGSVVTVLQGSHGRAIHGLCERLVNPANEGSSHVVSALGCGSLGLPDRFQIVFKASLVPSANHVSNVSNVEIAAWRAYPDSEVPSVSK